MIICKHTRLCITKLRNLKTSLLPKNQKMQAIKEKIASPWRQYFNTYVRVDYRCINVSIHGYIFFYYKNRLFFTYWFAFIVFSTFFCQILEYFIIIIMFINWCTVINPVSVHFPYFLLQIVLHDCPICCVPMFLG